MAPRELPVVSLVGRPNVGKSTLFNRVLRRRLAVVDDSPGVTRDRHAAVAEWEEQRFLLVDTGGLLVDHEGIIESRVRDQVDVAVEESEVVLLVVDGREGPLPDDYEVIEHLRRRGAIPMLVVTKIDATSLEPGGLEFAALGIEDLFLVSGLEGRGLDELMDAVVERLPQRGPAPRRNTIRLAVIGRPNVGKSSLVNALLQEERMIVSDIPGTTRDAVDTDFRYEGREFTLVDTAGLKRRSRLTTGVEFYSALRTARTLDEADVAAVLLDASEPVSRQDLRVAAMPFEQGVSVVFVFNKWDLVDKETNTARDHVREAARHLPDFKHAPSVFISALTTQRVSRVMPAVISAYDAARDEIPADDLNEFLDEAVVARSHPWVRGKMIRFWGMRQVGVGPPAFIVYCSRPQAVEENWRRFLLNRLRDRWGFKGSPLRVLFRRK